MVSPSLFPSVEQSQQSLREDYSSTITFIILTKNHSRQVKQLIKSILEANIKSVSILLIDDSNLNQFKQNKTFLQSLATPFRHLNSNQVIELVKESLKKVELTEEETCFIQNCAGINPPFLSFTERLNKLYRSRKPLAPLHFAPYSIARNLGVFCAVRSFRPNIIFFLDDDCKISNPVDLDTHIKLIGSELDQRSIIAVSGQYRSANKIQETHYIEVIIRVVRGMQTFLRKSLRTKKTGLQVKPSHMLGGVLILGEQAFKNLPFDPFVARGEDHMYALDLITVIGQNWIFVRDPTLIIDHEGTPSKPKEELNLLRDSFRFLYCRTKTGQSFIPFFLIRWIIASILDFLFYSHNFRRCKLELFTLLYQGQVFAKKKGNTFRRNIPTWEHFIQQLA